eukprot:COSAG02_NODE_11379_length_1736_cov_1.534514_1_plen_452_part_00
MSALLFSPPLLALVIDTLHSMRRVAAVALFVANIRGEDSHAPATAARMQTGDSPRAKPPVPAHRQQLLVPSPSAAAVASYAMTDCCGSPPSGQPTRPMPPATATHGVEIVFGDYNITVCNNTAWTFRSLWHGGVAVLTPTGFTQTVTNVNLHKHPCASIHKPPPPLPPSNIHAEGTGGEGNWTQCSKIFSECPAVGLLEGGAGVAECEAKCASTANCTAFNLRMVHPGGCSLRNCPPGTVPTSGTAPTFASYVDYPIHCDPYKPPPPGPLPPPPLPPGPKPCPETTTSLWPPLRPVKQPIIPITPCGAGWGPQPGLPGGGPIQGNETCSGFLGTGHGGEYVYSVSLHAGDEVINLLDASPTARKQWPIISTPGPLPAAVASATAPAPAPAPARAGAAAGGGGISRISIIKESQLGGYLATQNVTLSSDGMTATANYTLAYDNTLHHVNCEC